MKNTLLIVGGTGFFGLSILDFLNKNNNKFSKIIIVSRSRKNLLLKKFNNLNMKLINTDVDKMNILPKCDNIIYLISQKNYKNDIRSFKNFSKLLLKKKFKGNFLYTSSGAVYNYSKSKSLSNNIYNNYAKAKIENEKIIRSISSKRIKCSIIRCFSFVGLYLPLKSKYVIGNFINSVLNGEKIIIKNCGNIIRSYMHADDLSNNLLKRLSNSNEFCSTFNLGSNDNVNLKNIAYKLSKKFNVTLEYKKEINKNDKYVPSKYNSKFVKNIPSKNKSYSAIIKTIRQFKKKS